MNRSSITDPRLNAPFRKTLGEAFQVCPRKRVFRTDQLITGFVFGLVALALLGGAAVGVG